MAVKLTPLQQAERTCLIALINFKQTVAELQKDKK